jgi:phosphate transport system ATP-binding protein
MNFKTHISVKDLNVYYNKERALKNINIDIPDKKITVIIGPSGCGKTTLLKSFNRLLDISEGTTVKGQVLVDGENIYDKNAEITGIRKKMGLLLQKPCPLPMSIYDNVAYGPRIHGVKARNKLDETVEYYLKECSLWDEVKDKLNMSAMKLSLGQQQRLCLARGLAVEPEIILGDEPTSSLDPISSRRIEEKFIQLKSKYTIVLVWVILRQAKRLADYIVFIYLGELIEHGEAEEILNNPKMELTKEYIKGMIS